MANNTTNTRLDLTVPAVTFARVNNNLNTFNVTVPDTVTTYIIDPFIISLSQFKQAFYNNNVTLSYYNHNTDTNSSDLDKAKLRNILFLSSGGGPFEYGTPPQTETLPKKQITFGTGAPQDYIFNTFIIETIEEKTEQEYETWSIDSQIDLADQLADIQYISDFSITTTNSKSLSYTELAQTVNTYILKYYGVPGKTMPTPGTNVPVILNFVANFDAIIEKTKIVNNVTTTIPSNITIQILFQYKVNDWKFETVSFV